MNDAQPLSAADIRFRQLVTEAAERIRTEDSPYDSGMQLMGDIVHEVIFTADHAGGTYLMWAELTDGIDGPPPFARGLDQAQIEQLMRQAAVEWLELEHTSANVRRYLDRWGGWPDSVTSSPGPTLPGPSGSP